MKIAIIGFGEAGHMFGKHLSRHADVHVYDLRQDASIQSDAAEAGVIFHNEILSTIDNASYIFSLVTPDQSPSVAREVAQHINSSQYFLEMNSVAPEIKQNNASICSSLVDVAIMAPVYPKEANVPLLLSHPEGNKLVMQLERLGLNVDAVGTEIGHAAAIKILRSVMIKGLEALTLEWVQAAKYYGVEDNIKASLDDSFPGMGWNDGRVDYYFERVTTHGARRAEEMQEAVNAVKAANVSPEMSQAIVATLKQFMKKQHQGL